MDKEIKGKLDNVSSTTITAYILQRGVVIMVTITTHDGRVYTDPSQIKVLRNENTEMFYRFLESFAFGKGKKETA